jgi:two-component system chemotaxis sensor kinase CheA
VAEDRQQKYLRMFREEISDHVDVINSSLAAFENSRDPSEFKEVVRRLHTIKGSAYMIGFSEAGELAHRMEDFLKLNKIGEGHESDSFVQLLYEAMDVLVSYIESGLGTDDAEIRSGKSQLADFLDRVKSMDLSSSENKSGNGSSQVEPVLSDEEINELIRSEARCELIEQSVSDATAVSVDRERGSETGKSLAPGEMSEGSVRVDITKLDKLLELVSELVTFQSRLTAKTSHIPDLLEDMIELGYLVEDIHCQTMEARMLPVSTIVQDFYRTLRTLSRELGKKSILQVQGKTVEVDKRILELVRPVIIHTLRNAIDHGIEFPEERIKAGKNEQGTISFNVTTDGTFITFTIADDGRGVDGEKLSQKAVSMGLISSSDVSKISRKKLLELMFETGLSTAANLSSLSGRGVGMDVVKRSVEEMKGTLSVESDAGSGTAVSFSVPTSLSVISALMVEAGGQVYALPMIAVEETVRFTNNEILKMGSRSGINLRGEALVLSYLPTLIGFSGVMPMGSKFNGVVVKNGSERLAVVVDNIIGDEEIVVKSLGKHINSVRYVSGATFMPSGKPALILNTSHLFYSCSLGNELLQSAANIPVSAKILIIDDSRTTQMMETSILEAAGYITHAESSAEEAIEFLEKTEPFDLFVIDIEMPGMNGIELIQWMNKDKRFSAIPKILLSSASSHEGWELAQSLGVSACIKKQSFNQENFLRTIRDLLL